MNGHHYGKENRRTANKMNLDNIPAEDTFHFDDWAQLYKTDKQAFEARKQMIIALELAKATHISVETRQNLSTLTSSLAGKSDQERLELSLKWMVNSAEQLHLHLQALALALNTKTSTNTNTGMPSQKT
jgi:hypothetical protein